ncbi:MAG: type IV pilus modification protein PilV [Moraxellaceae bacterium]|jgi:type IV pilus modification protein PilV|nr:MAG: type IV pilus modification protein PilV [Moraxellaceae bacterium]
MLIKTNNNICKQNGSSLIETMVSLFVLAIGLLGTLAMQTKSIQHNQNSYSYSQAIVLATDLNERLKTASNPDTVVTDWNDNFVKEYLPNGKSELVRQAAGVQIITLKFAERSAGESDRTSRELEFRTWL